MLVRLGLPAGDPMTAEPDDADREYLEAVMLGLVADGYLELAGVGTDGEIRYRLTPAGEARVRAMLAENADER